MAATKFAPAVTVSATYGTGGSSLAPRLAEEMGVPFLDRFLSADLSQAAAEQGRSEEGLVEGEHSLTPAGRFLSYFSRAASVGAMVAPDVEVSDDRSIREQVTAGLGDVIRGGPAVVLGRAGAVVLASRPRTFHVRLDAPVERRLAFAAQFEKLDEESAKRRQAEADRARTLFVKRLYRIDPADVSLYHLVLDTTVFGRGLGLKVVLTAVQSFFEANP
jgi:cytidylate kinase